LKIRKHLYINFFLASLLIHLTHCGDTEVKSQIPINPSPEDTLDLTVDSSFSTVAEKIDDFFFRRFTWGTFNGAVLFAEDGNIIYKNAYGYSNFRTKDTLTTQSAFQIASATKPFTSYAIMLLKERGQLSYDDSLQKFFPDIPYEKITIRQLLIHKSGLSNYMYFTDEYWLDKHIAISNNDVINLIIEYSPMPYYKPGIKYHYCNTNYMLLASIIEKVSGMSYADFMEKEIFKPLGMINTSVYNKIEEPESNHKVVGYVSRRRKAENSYQNGVVGDKGIYSTVEDIFKFDQALYRDTLVSQETLEEAFQPAHSNRRKNYNYGFGWYVSEREDGRKIVYHTGWWKGFRSYFIRILNERKTIIVLGNISNINQFGSDELIELFD